MKVWKVMIATALAAVTVALLTASVFACLYGQGINNPNGSYTNGGYAAYPGGMMGGMMGNAFGHSQSSAQPGASAPYVYQYGKGCHGRMSSNSHVGSTYPYNGATITIDEAVAIAQRYSASLGNPDLAVDEVEEYTQNFYVLFYEKSTGNGAFEMIIDKYTGGIYPEMGPNMMWNTKYGMISGGMMGLVRGTPTTAMPVTLDQAKANAQQYLGASLAGTAVGDATIFYGYYHIDVLLAGNTYGMLSVNGYTGQVWYHTWHGTFVQKVEL